MLCGARLSSVGMVGRGHDDILDWQCLVVVVGRC